MRSLGHALEQRDPDYGPGAIPAVVARYLRGTHDDVGALAHPERLERRTRAMARLGGLISPELIERALAGEQRFAARVNGVLEDHDVLLTPATATPPPRVGQLQGRGALWTLNAVAGMVPYNGVWNVTGSTGGLGPDRRRLRRAAARSAARGPQRRRGDAFVARRPDRVRASVGAAPSRSLLVNDDRVSCSTWRSRPRGWPARCWPSVRCEGAEREVSAKSTPTDLVSEADLGVRARDRRAARPAPAG